MSSKTKTTATKEEATPALVPKLRFPKFREAPAWESDLLGKLAEMRSGGTPLSSVPEYYDGDIPWVSIADMTKAGKFITSTARNLSRAGLESCAAQIFPVGTVIYAMYASIGECSITEVPLCSSQAILGIRPSGGLYNEFLYYYLTLLKPRVKTLGQHGTQANLNKSIVQNLRFPLPAPAEQQEIAECLSSVDELMAAQGRKVDALKTHKKGLMQQLFPREGETQPRLRFPEFQKAGEWEEQPLKKVFSIFQGFAFSSGDSVEQGCRWLKIADVGIQVMTHDAPSFLPEAYQERFSKFAVRAGDYVVALTRPILSGQLKIAKVDDVFDGALLNQRVGKLITSQHPAFVFLLLQTKKLIGDIERSISGNDPPNLSAQQIEGLKTYVPRPAEQERIATCLSSLDALITAETQKHEALKTHKKGLMQQLFPSPEDCTE